MTVSPQMSIDFTPGLLEQYPDLMDCVRAAVYGCGKPLKIIAADCDLSESGLSRRLANNPDDQVHFPLHKLPALVRATDDTRPIEWLMLSLMQNPEEKRQHAVRQIAQLAPIMQNLIAQLGAMAQPMAKGRAR